MADISSIKVNKGDVFGHWTVVSIYTAQKVECVCRCGYVKEQRQTDLLRGATKQCPSCYAKKPKAGIETGKRFGKWTVVDVEDYTYLYRRNGKVLERQYRCICDCGTEKYIRTSHITRGLSKQCGTCRMMDYSVSTVGCIPTTDIKRYKAGAAKRNKEWNITSEYLYELYEKQNRLCALTGIPIQFSQKGIGTPGAKDVSTASLDRIDSTKGYTPDNIQWIHKDVNKMKMDLEELNFLRIVKQIYEYKQL